MAVIVYSGAADYPGATIRVRLEGLNDLAPIYADPLLTPKANPTVTDPNTGAYTFWADDAESYTIETINEDGTAIVDEE